MNRMGFVDRDGIAVDMAAQSTVLESILSVLQDTLTVNIANASLAITSSVLTSILSALQGTLIVSDSLTPDTFVTVSALSVATEATLWTPASGKKWQLLGGLLSNTGATANITLKDGVSGSTVFTLPSNLLGTVFQFSIPGGKTSGAIDTPLRALGTTLQVLNGTIWGREITP